MRLRKFNKQGFEAFSSYVRKLAVEPDCPLPREYLEDAAFVEHFSGSREVEPKVFANRFEAGQYLVDLLDGVDSPERDTGLWAWLTLFFFDQVCPADGNGNRKPGNEARVIPLLDNHQRFYRHLLLGPYLVVRANHTHPELAMAMLVNPVFKPGDISEQLASRKELVTNRSVAEVATKLYYDAGKKAMKKGAGSKGRGSPRRLATILNQLDVTFYLYDMSADEILGLLPKEFDRFKKTA